MNLLLLAIYKYTQHGTLIPPDFFSSLPPFPTHLSCILHALFALLFRFFHLFFLYILYAYTPLLPLHIISSIIISIQSVTIASLQSRLDESTSRYEGLQSEVLSLTGKLKDQEIRNERLSAKLQQRCIRKLIHMYREGATFHIGCSIYIRTCWIQYCMHGSIAKWESFEGENLCEFHDF